MARHHLLCSCADESGRSAQSQRLLRWPFSYGEPGSIYNVFASVFASHWRRSLATNSGPLSDRRCSGTPFITITSASAEMTMDEDHRRSARHQALAVIHSIAGTVTTSRSVEKRSMEADSASTALYRVAKSTTTLDNDACLGSSYVCDVFTRHCAGGVYIDPSNIPSQSNNYVPVS